MKNIFEELRKTQITAPFPDMIQCYDCGKMSYIHECPTESEGDWETGYYDYPVCPNGCEGNYDYTFSPEQLKKYEEFEKENKCLSLIDDYNKGKRYERKDYQK
jgi:hypothetical protein